MDLDFLLGFLDVEGKDNSYLDLDFLLGFLDVEGIDFPWCERNYFSLVLKERFIEEFIGNSLSIKIIEFEPYKWILLQRVW